MMTKQLETPLNASIMSRFDLISLEHNDSTKAYREQAMDAFRSLGFPSIKNEEWRFTNVSPLVKTAYTISSSNTISEELLQEAKQMLAKSSNFTLDGAYTLVSVNGIFVEELSHVPQYVGLTVKAITEAQDEQGFQTHFGKILNIKNGFAALNSAMFQDGFYISLDAKVILDNPIHIIKIITTDETLLMQSRDLFVLGKQAELNVVESYITQATGNVLLNTGAEVVLEENAQFHHYDIQKTSANVRIIQHTEASQQQHSNYSNYTFTFPGADFVRNNLILHLDAKQIECHLYGLYLSADHQLVDNHTEVHHKMPHGESNQLYKGIMMDSSRAVFNGKIFVYEDAQKTNAFQQSNNVLLSEKAIVNAKPQLEIFADDVKCSHGTTIGQIDKDALFYLRSRGIGEFQAKQLMVKAFAFDVAEKIQIPALRTYVENMISADMDRD